MTKRHWLHHLAVGASRCVGHAGLRPLLSRSVFGFQIDRVLPSSNSDGDGPACPAHERIANLYEIDQDVCMGKTFLQEH